MSTKFRQLHINPDYQALFAFKTKEEERAYEAQAMSYRILSEVEKICEDRNMTKRDLAAAVGTSASYITQLFRGAKQVNLDMMTRFEDALDACFEIKIRCLEQAKAEFIFRQVEEIGTRRVPVHSGVWYKMEQLRGTPSPQETCEAIASLIDKPVYKERLKQIA
jgi:transcriptional regulator with XRE-family HTH domain